MAKTLSHTCEKSAELATLQEQVADLTHIIKDNGQPGLATTTTRLVVATERLCEDVNNLRTVVSAFDKYITGEDAKKQSRQWMATILPSVFAVILSVIIMLWGTGVVKKQPLYRVIDGNTIIMRDGSTQKLDSIYWNDKDNPPMNYNMN